MNLETTNRHIVNFDERMIAFNKNTWMGKIDGEIGNVFDIQFFKYKSSWDWLMPIIEKISKIRYEEWEQDTGFETYKVYDTAYPVTFGMINSKTGNTMFRFNRHQCFEAETLIEAAFMAVADFLQPSANTDHD